MEHSSRCRDGSIEVYVMLLKIGHAVRSRRDRSWGAAGTSTSNSRRIATWLFMIAGDLQEACKPLCFSLVSQITTEVETEGAFGRDQVWPGPVLTEHEGGM